MSECSQTQKKTLWKKEKLLIKSNFSFSHSVFIKLVLQTHKITNDNFKFDENGRMFSNPIENTEGKGEITHYEQFLLFPQCFYKTCTADT